MRSKHIMGATITLGIFRRLDNRIEGHDDTSHLALVLHNRRRDALHAVLDGDRNLRVLDWGKTDDTTPHEFVEIALSATATAVFTYAIIPGVKWIGVKLAEKAVDTAVGEVVKALFAKLRPMQDAKQMLDFVVSLPDGTRITVDAPDRSGTVTINFTDGTLQSLQYTKAADANAQ